MNKLSWPAREQLAHAAGWDAGNRSARLHGRKAWNPDDLRKAIEIRDETLGGKENERN